MARNNKIKEYIIYLFVVVIIGGLIIAWLSASPPIFYVANDCYQTLYKDFTTDSTINLYNKGKEIGYATFCISSKEFVFKTEDDTYNHNMCFNEMNVPPKESDLMQQIQIKIKPDANSFDSLEKASYTFEIKCRQEVWGILGKNCDSLIRTCKYNKVGNSFNKV